jgi:hypothetical protein
MLHRTRENMLSWHPEKSTTAVAFFAPAKDEAIERNINGVWRREVVHRLGDLHFYPDSLTMGVIAHECFHAVIAWASQFGTLPHTDAKDSPEPDREELCAELIGILVKEFCVGCADIGYNLEDRLSVTTEY